MALRLHCLPNELLARANSAELSEMFVHFALIEQERREAEFERQITAEMGEA